MSGWNKLNIAQATTSDLTCLKSWDLEKTAFKEIQFPKRETGLPRQMVNPTLLCSYAFFSLESYNRFRLRKINQIMKKQWKQKTRRTSVRMSADWFRQEGQASPSDQFSCTFFSCRIKIERATASDVKYVFHLSHRFYFGSPCKLNPYQFLFWQRKYNDLALK